MFYIIFNKSFLDELGEKIGAKELDDWYSISSKIISKEGGSGLLSKYGGSPAAMFSSLFTEHPWDLKAFNKSTDWSDKENSKVLLYLIS